MVPAKPLPKHKQGLAGKTCLDPLEISIHEEKMKLRNKLFTFQVIHADVGHETAEQQHE